MMPIPASPDWKKCPSGDLGRLATRLRKRRYLHVCLGAGIAVLGTGLVVVAAHAAISSWTQPYNQPPISSPSQNCDSPSGSAVGAAHAQ